MSSRGRRFNEATNLVQKVQGVKRDGHAKALAKRPRIPLIFQGTYSRGSNRPTLPAKSIQSPMSASKGNY